MKYIKNALYIIYILIFFILLGLQIYSGQSGSGISVSNIIYWMILIGWLVMIVEKKVKSEKTMHLAFYLFIISSVILIIGFKPLAEIFMKTSFVGWMIGLTQAYIEYKLGNGGNH